MYGDAAAIADAVLCGGRTLSLTRDGCGDDLADGVVEEIVL